MAEDSAEVDLKETGHQLHSLLSVESPVAGCGNELPSSVARGGFHN
jgi:hypothetical protein